MTVLALSLASCREAEAPAAATQDAAGTLVFAGEGRDRLCLKQGEQRAGFITFAATGDTNCSVRGSTDGKVIRPDGDEQCAIIMNRVDDSITLLRGGPACAYYCGPDASFAGKSFDRMDKPEAVTDFAGDPLC